MVLKPNEKPLFNVLLLLKLMLLHVTSSSNTNKLKSVLFVNSKTSVFNKLTHKLISNNMVLHFLMLAHSFNKLVLLVLLKISYVLSFHSSHFSIFHCYF